jgi:AraC-like DNA-binding protein
MSILYQERLSDSPYVETITQGRTVSDASVIRPAESRWHMIFVKQHGSVRPLVVGPWTTAGVVSYTEGAELLWIRFKLGVFMPHLPTKDILDLETTLPGASWRSFWLHRSTWQFPDYENVETFVDRLVRAEALVRDPVVNAALNARLPEIASRTVRHRFLRATGLTQSHIRQWERAQQAAALLQQGVSIPDAMFEAGYFDQPHLTRSLKRFIGYTPAQIIRMRAPA